MDKDLMSANFKKDYIAYSAVVIFFLILSFELFMAIFIPAHLQLEDVWSKEVSRQEMIAAFDGVHRRFLRFKSKRGYTEAEAKIIANSLTPLADYLREYQYKINLKQIDEVDKAIKGLHKFADHLSKEGAYSDNLKLKPEKFITKLKKEMEKTN